MGMDVYCEEFGLIGKIDMFDIKRRILRERKKRIKVIYDGYVLQLYGQLYALREMGYLVEELQLYSMDDNKVYRIELPEKNKEMDDKFRDVLKQIRNFRLDGFVQNDIDKCQNCIYEPACYSTLLEG